MNILIICRCLGVGGAERVATIWANELHELGNDVFILADTSMPRTYYVHPDVEVLASPKGLYQNLGFIKNLRNRIAYIRQIKNIIEEKSIDAIVKVMHVNSIELLIARHLSKSHPSIIMTDHNTYERPASAPMRLMSKIHKFWLNRLYDKVTVLTQRDKEITINHGLKNVEVLYNPLSLEPIAKDTITNRSKVILAVGRLDSWHVKGFDNLIKAWDLICNKHQDWTLRIIGRGSDKAVNYLYTLSHHPSQLEIKDFNQNISEEYQGAEIFVLSSRYEGWGLVLVEAMSQGCACIASDYLGRQSEIIENNINGLLCPAEDVKSLSITLDKLIKNSNLRLDLQRNAPKSTERFSKNKIAKALQEIIKETLV